MVSGHMASKTNAPEDHANTYNECQKILRESYKNYTKANSIAQKPSKKPQKRQMPEGINEVALIRSLTHKASHKG